MPVAIDRRPRRSGLPGVDRGLCVDLAHSPVAPLVHGDCGGARRLWRDQSL